ncbi:MAG: peptide chain release factor N(5)-glutamine methyltransferase [Planctomycetes bacterium]|nr:peptide chain release factor N(5)-glutamine methyltransferase [Planctomycetota bacterium]
MSDPKELPRTSGEMLARAREFLAKKDVPEGRLEAELLVAHALGLDRLHLFLDLERPVNEVEVARARDFLVRRSKREPTAYILGRRDFYGRGFEVNSAVLIPRPETELVVDHARAFARSRMGALTIGDFGTGSGCLAVTLALELAGSTVFAADVSSAALEVARKNAERLAAHVTFVEAAAPRALVEAAGAKFDLLVSNPPYVGTDERASLASEVRDHEPHLALFAPEDDPDHWLRRLVEDARELVASGGALFVELGHRQADSARELAKRAGLEPRLHLDLARIPRVLELRVG